jgi:hypothetical protein
VAAARGVCPTWKNEGRPARATRAVGGGTERRVEQDQKGAELQGGAQGRAGAAACSRGENSEKIGIGEDEGDLVVKSRKHRGLTIMYR